ncbi:MAG TPA: amidohydrolase family protein [Candidatus Binataceae bacterium]
MKTNSSRITKSFAVFDCDAHVNDPTEIWTKYVEPQYREQVKQAYWNDGSGAALLNGQLSLFGGHFPAARMAKKIHPMTTSGPGRINGITIGGPGVNKKVQRRLQRMNLTQEQAAYVDHKGAYDPHARVKELDLMGIDQVLVIPTMLVNAFPFIRNAEGAHGLARAYNNWARDWCDTAPDRLYPSALLPIQNTDLALKELERVLTMNFPVVLMRPIDANGNYPNRLLPSMERSAGAGAFGIMMDPLLRAIEESGVVLGIHTFPSPLAMGIDPIDNARSPGDYVERSGRGTGRVVVSSTFSFILEATVWLSQVLLSGLLDRYPRLKMAIFESNATWLPSLLNHCDRLFKLYANERRSGARRLPSQAFYEQCMISFEAEEDMVFRQYENFENVGVWASDVYHPDAAEAWEAIAHMRQAEVPVSVQEKLMGGNARRFYGIQGKLFTTEQPESIARPQWFPQGGEALEQWWEQEAHPRQFKRAGKQSSPGY